MNTDQLRLLQESFPDLTLQDISEAYDFVNLGNTSRVETTLDRLLDKEE